jgi:hypothetical protein
MSDASELLRINHEVTSERNPEKRRAAIEQAYVEDLRFIDSAGEVTGRHAFSDPPASERSPSRSSRGLTARPRRPHNCVRVLSAVRLSPGANSPALGAGLFCAAKRSATQQIGRQ